MTNTQRYFILAEALSKKRKGLSREEIIKETNLPANGVLTKMLSNLEKTGFIRINDMYGHKKKDRIYQLSDYYSIFYFKYIKDNFGKDEHYWSNTNDNPSRRAWEGLTFEQICKDHVNQIKKNLGISGVLTEISSWAKQGNDDEEGARIDMLIDRRDRVINLCEIKFSSLPYEIDKGCDAS